MSKRASRLNGLNLKILIVGAMKDKLLITALAIALVQVGLAVILVKLSIELMEVVAMSCVPL